MSTINKVLDDNIEYINKEHIRRCRNYRPINKKVKELPSLSITEYTITKKELIKIQKEIQKNLLYANQLIKNETD